MIVSKAQFAAIFLVTFLTCVCNTAADRRRVNCRKYVYAPICRGVAAKRAITDAHSVAIAEDRHPIADGEYMDLQPDSPKSLHYIDPRGPLATLFRRITPNEYDYDTGTLNYLN